MVKQASTLRTTGFSHQLEAVKRCFGQEYFGLLMEQGTGKSWATLARALKEFLEHKIEGLVVIAPKGVYRNWEDQLKQHWPAEVEYELATWSSYQLAADKQVLGRQLAAAVGKKRVLRVLLMNVEALSTKEVGKKTKGVLGKGTTDLPKQAVAYLRAWLLANQALMVVDESTTIKSKSSNRTKNLIDVRSLAKYRMILSGHPVPKSPVDLFSQCLFLKRGCIPYTSKLAFEAEFVVKRVVRYGARSFLQVVGYQRLDELRALIEPFTFRVTKAECLDLPPKVYVTREVELTVEQKKHYNMLAEQFRAEVGGNVTTALHAMTRVMRLHQLACGYLVSDDDKKVTEIPSNRISGLLEELEEIDAPTVVWAPYRYSLEMLARELTKAGYKVSEYWGNTSDTERQKSIADFRSGKTNIFLGNPAVGGMGITLTEASHTIYFANTANLESRRQSEDRVHRIGTRMSVRYVDLVARGTVDERWIELLRQKNQAGGMILGDDPSEWMEWLKNV